MNTKPADITLARWLDDDLQGPELAAFESSVHADPALLARRQQRREWRATLAAAIPAVIEPAYPEFFNHRIAKAIREQWTTQPPARTTPPPARPAAAWWRVWWMPATAVAGMTLAFWVGTKNGQVTRVVALADPASAPLVVPAPAVYTPEHGVAAEAFTSPDAAATVIVLEGVDAIPDTLDFSESVGWHGTGKATAALDEPETAEVEQ
ncbi:MAG: hypothetical protein WCK77_18490 [Verrucomicrobiota bacterium]